MLARLGLHSFICSIASCQSPVVQLLHKQMQFSCSADTRGALVFYAHEKFICFAFTFRFSCFSFSIFIYFVFFFLPKAAKKMRIKCKFLCYEYPVKARKRSCQKYVNLNLKLFRVALTSNIRKLLPVQGIRLSRACSAYAFLFALFRVCFALCILRCLVVWSVDKCSAPYRMCVYLYLNICTLREETTVLVIRGSPKVFLVFLFL